ncbi:hypothetical protein CAEBREN_04554 [Caenorhabditis brenneri]|uniref:Uncharacterized protein n=1 Tax=Caenorhabditis brenneri TaxID=135651 RepID=G0MA50_CAEBE|nr:hypothetical protein CAEBREN_04554 [Caenorhabditis brenneri]
MDQIDREQADKDAEEQMNREICEFHESFHRNQHMIDRQRDQAEEEILRIEIERVMDQEIWRAEQLFAMERRLNPNISYNDRLNRNNVEVLEKLEEKLEKEYTRLQNNAENKTENAGIEVEVGKQVFDQDGQLETNEQLTDELAENDKHHN